MSVNLHNQNPEECGPVQISLSRPNLHTVSIRLPDEGFRREQSRALYANMLGHAHRERVPVVPCSSSPRVGSVLLRIPVSSSVAVVPLLDSVCLVGLNTMIRTVVVPVLLSVICARRAAGVPDGPDAQGTKVRLSVQSFGFVPVKTVSRT